MIGQGSERAAAAARLLIEARLSGSIESLPEACRPRDVAEAYAIQDAVAERLGPIEGWKVGAGGPEEMPACAPLLAGSVMVSPARLDPARYPLRGIEAEIAFRFARDLPPRESDYSRDEVTGAIESALVAIEVCECRFRDRATLDPLSKLADNNLNAALVIGEPWPGSPDLTIARQAVRLSFDDRVVVEKHGGNTAGDLIRLLVWLANHLRRRGPGIARGQVVTTGSWTGLIPAGPARHIAADFEGIGTSVVTF